MTATPRPDRRASLLLAALCAAALALPAGACGPDFPVTLLDARRETLLELGAGVFDFEVARLLPAPTPRFQPDDNDTWTPPEELRTTAEAQGLDSASLEKIAAMRASDSAITAESVGAGLAPELLQYTAGAVAWHHGALDPAHAYFRAVVALPAAERPLRGVWASYMDARALALNGDVAGADAAFARTREWVAAGAADPFGLAVASFGEQARARLDAGDAVGAVELYAEQAAHGSRSGSNSLLFVARKALVDAAMREQLLADALGRQLLVAYLFARSHELARLEAPPESDPWELPLADPDHAAVLGLLEALSTADPASLPEADRLAAVAYRAGRYEQAERFAMAKASPLSAWVRAKLALRNGDPAAAASAYAEAAKGFAPNEHWGTLPIFSDGFVSGGEALEPHCRIQAEAGTLALARGDYVQALELLFAAADNYWTDAAYVAERVVTVDELKAFVDRVVPNAVAAPPAPVGADVEYYVSELAPGARLRWLLARRLLREGHQAAALGYFDNPELRIQAQAYVQAQKDSSAAFFKLDRARAGFSAAQLARSHGMELLGYEGDPDYLIHDGQFDLNDPTTWDADYNAIQNPRTDLAVVGEFTTDGERTRVSASRAQPLSRFHYRQVAAEHARAAADLLPPRSQAFAAVLCSATRWLIDREPEPAAALYRRYLNEGAWVAWGASFGRECPAPDFDKVARERNAQWVKRGTRVGLWMLPVLLAFGLLVVVRRRRRLSV